MAAAASSASSGSSFKGSGDDGAAGQVTFIEGTSIPVGRPGNKIIDRINDVYAAGETTVSFEFFPAKVRARRKDLSAKYASANLIAAVLAAVAPQHIHTPLQTCCGFLCWSGSSELHDSLRARRACHSEEEFVANGLLPWRLASYRS